MHALCCGGGVGHAVCAAPLGYVWLCVRLLASVRRGVLWGNGPTLSVVEVEGEVLCAVSVRCASLPCVASGCRAQQSRCPIIISYTGRVVWGG